MILNIEQNKFLNPAKFIGLTGIWVLNEGVYFNTPEDAHTNYRNNKTGNEMNPIMKELNVNGITYYQKVATNLFD